ncbi:MAG: hypothetical protein KKH11_03595 [Candidatus Omnitrophica bacterium]|nr:hypothetical protein [Candidatus Omnitrophota bacterium]
MNKSFLALGVLVGAFTGIGCFWLLVRNILQSPFIGLQKVKPYFFLKYLTRYAIMGAVLFLCARIGLEFFIGAAGGLLLVQLVAITIVLRTCKIQGK